MKIIIPLNPVTKKNHSQIVMRNGKPRLLPSKQFLQYQKNVGWFLNGHKAPKGVLNIKAVYFMQTKRKVDLTNLNSALHDVLVHYGVIPDDSTEFVGASDGSRVKYDPENPRTVVTLTLLSDDN
jgi:Holliday junction resolvase RusA-like endonuclease